MFFIGGITQGTKELVYNAAAMICGRCGRYGRYQVFMTYMCLSFFFIPIFKWGHDAPAWDVPLKRCSNCGYETKENFEYCPKCGKRF